MHREKREHRERFERMARAGIPPPRRDDDNVDITVRSPTTPGRW